MGRTCRACSRACAKHRTLNRYFHPEHTPESQGYQIWFYARFGLVAQWTRARGYELRCRGFESLLARTFHRKYFCRCGGIGRRARFRFSCFFVRVRVSPSVQGRIAKLAQTKAVFFATPSSKKVSRLPRFVYT